MIFFDIDYLRTNCARLYFFGLGFIQVKLNEEERVHFYTKKFNATSTIEEIHNHRYDFESTILKGTIKQELFTCSIDARGDHVMTRETCRPDRKSTMPDRTCRVNVTHRQVLFSGSSYWIDHETFHRVESDDAITYLKRGPYVKDEADVVRPVHQSMVCPFSVKVSDDELWDTIDEMLKRQ